MKKNRMILHVVPDSLVKPEHFYLGSTKDIRARTEYFNDRHYTYNELIIKNRSDKFLLSELKKMDLSNYDLVFYEFALFPRSMTYVRRKYPAIKQVVRSINADFYHFLHYFYATMMYPAAIFLSRKTFFEFITLHWVRHALKRLYLDFTCARLADAVLSIVEWERRNYWRFIADAQKVHNLPYYLPDVYSFEVSKDSKRDQCVCLMSTTEGVLPLLRDAAFRFFQSVDKLKSKMSDWRFLTTGDLSKLRIKMPARVETTGFLQTPFPILAESRCMALLSELGYGFKTKMLDAVQSNCYILVLSGLYTRLPEELKPYCIVVNLKSPDSFEIALEQSKRPFPGGNLNQLFKQQAWMTLDKVLGE